MEMYNHSYLLKPIHHSVTLSVCCHCRSSWSSIMYVWAIWSVSCFDSFWSFPNWGRYCRNLSNAKFKLSIRLRSRALAASLRFFRTIGDNCFTHLSTDTLLCFLRFVDILKFSPILLEYRYSFNCKSYPLAIDDVVLLIVSSDMSSLLPCCS